MAKAVGEHDVAAAVSQVGSLLVAILGFLNAGDDEEVLVLHHAQSGAGFAGSVDEVEVIGGVFVMQGDEADLDVGLGFRKGGGAAQAESKGQQQGDELFHDVFLRLKIGMEFGAFFKNTNILFEKQRHYTRKHERLEPFFQKKLLNIWKML